MRRVLGVVGVCLLGALALLFILSKQASQIAPGISINGVAVGGRSAEEAEQLLAQQNAQLVIYVDGQKHSYPLQRFDYRLQTEQALQKALRLSEQRNFLQRISDAEIERQFSTQPHFDKQKVRDLLQRLERRYQSQPTEAQLIVETDAIEVRRGQTGRSLKIPEQQLFADITQPLHVHTEKVEPAMLNRADVAAAFPTYLTVDQSDFTLRLFKDLQLVASYPVATGMSGFDTPTGTFSITNKAVDPVWSVPAWGGALAGQQIPGGVAENPLKERWLGIQDGVGIHGTADVASLGSFASHGCIRMDPQDVIELYDQVPVGIPILIQ